MDLKKKTQYQWEIQDPKMEVLYHIRPYFVGIFPYIGLKNRPKIYGIGTSNESVPEMAIDNTIPHETSPRIQPNKWARKPPVAYGIAGPPAPSSQPLHGCPSAPAESQPTKRLGKVEVSTKRLGIYPLVN